MWAFYTWLVIHDTDAELGENFFSPKNDSNSKLLTESHNSTNCDILAQLVN